MEPSISIYLALGSNLGDRLANLQAASAGLAPDVRVLAASPVYETEPWGFTEQPSFLNQVLHGATLLSPLALLHHLKQIEANLGRAATFRYGPRSIDLDILFYAEMIFDTPELTIPHPRLHERAFVLVPLADLAPELRHPVLGQTITALLAELPPTHLEIYSP